MGEARNRGSSIVSRSYRPTLYVGEGIPARCVTLALGGSPPPRFRPRGIRTSITYLFNGLGYVNQTPQTGRSKFGGQLLTANEVIYLSTLYYKKNLDLTSRSEEDEVDQGGGAGEGSTSAFIEQDLIALLRHLEYSEGREKMSRQAKREHRTSRVSSSEHFKFPDDDHEKTY